MPRRKVTEEEAKKRCKALGFTLKSPFTKVNNKHLIEHDKCGYQWESYISNLSKLKDCPNCSGRMRWNKERLHKFLEGTDYRAVDALLPDNIKTDTKLYLHRFKDDIMVFTTIDHIKSSLNAGYRKTPMNDFDFNAMLLEKGCGLVKSEGLFDYMICYHCKHEWSRKSKHVRWKYKHEAVPCPNCRKSFHKGGGYDEDDKGYFYYLRVQPEDSTTPLYKIGITNRSVEERFCNSDLEKITVLRVLEFDNGQSAKDLESYYLKLFKDFRYQGEPILTSGNTELMTHDVLGLDT